MWWDKEIIHLAVWFVVLSIPDIWSRTEITRRYLIAQPIIKPLWETRVFDQELPGPLRLDLQGSSGWSGTDDEPLPMHLLMQASQTEMEFSNNATENAA